LVDRLGDDGQVESLEKGDHHKQHYEVIHCLSSPVCDLDSTGFNFIFGSNQFCDPFIDICALEHTANNGRDDQG